MEKGGKSSNVPINNPTLSGRFSAEAELEKLAPLQYEPLPKNSSLRLLQILPSSSASDIHCSLVTADLDDDALVFDALSYTWGNPVTIHERLNHVSAMSQLGELVDKVKAAKASAATAGQSTQIRPKPLVDLDAFKYRLNHPLQPYEHVDWNIERKHPIQCNGCRVMVTKNLLEALKILRRFHHGEVLGSNGFEKITGNPIAQNIWIDMICINQDDVSERNCQVSVMGRIFSQAQTVIGWLGPEETQSRLAVLALRALFREFVEVRKPPDELLPTALYAFKNVDMVSAVALFAFMQRLWFQRAWIVQEIVLAKRLVLVCGGVILRWEMLELVVYHIQNSGLLPPLQHFVTGLMTGTPTQKHLRQYANGSEDLHRFHDGNLMHSNKIW
ncbi:hypothetical protein N0V88_001573 [Collariella sp. IMI 366227]|nr:hypothetical protein N0V88_001573 [Collariella sp. IMI 366227]